MLVQLGPGESADQNGFVKAPAFEEGHFHDRKRIDW
jgi:hypothetical protein